MKFEWLKTLKGRIVFTTAASVFIYIFLILLIFGVDGGSSFWISFVYAIISIVLSNVVSYANMKRDKTLKDRIFGLPITRWCVIYVVAELAVSLLFMLVESHWKLVFIPQFLMPIFFFILVLPCFAQKEHISTVDKETKVKVSYIRQMNAKLIALVPRTEDAQLKSELQRAAELLRHSDPMSVSSLEEIEGKMSACVDNIDLFIRNGNYEDAAPLVKEMCLLIEERNQLVIASKLVQY